MRLPELDWFPAPVAPVPEVVREAKELADSKLVKLVVDALVFAVAEKTTSVLAESWKSL